MRTRAGIAGHPLHPMLIAFSTGVLPLAFLFDVMMYWENPPFGLPSDSATWAAVAALGTILGTLVLLVAAIPGFIDYFTISPREGLVWRRATTHMVIGLIVATLYVASSVVHALIVGVQELTGLHAAATTLNAIGAVGLGVQGWYGGEIVYKGQVGVDTTS